MNYKTSFFLIFFLSLLILLTGCGNDKSLTQFQDNMTQFTDNITEITNTLNAIDPTSETATDDLLLCLDNMNEQFQLLSKMEVPSKFSNVETLADEAATYMSEAVSLYHQYYSSTDFDESVRESAGENYGRAMKRIHYISELLQGNIPDDSEVVVTEEDGVDFEPVTEIQTNESDVAEPDTNVDTESMNTDVDNDNGPVTVGSKNGQ